MEDCKAWNYPIDLTPDSGDHKSECSLTNSCRKRKQEDIDDQDDDVEKKRLLANTQERARMHKINKALEDLRKCLPQQFNLYHRRLSKIRTLRIAMNYIRELSELIRNDDIQRQRGYGEVVSRAPVPVQTATPSILEMPTTIIPYYPYLREACSGYSAIESMYRTPDQTQQQQQPIYNPRQLNFSATTQSELTPSQPETIMAGAVCTPVKPRSTKRLFKVDGVLNPEPARGHCAETIATPYLGIRYQAEHSTGLSSAYIGNLRDDDLEPGQISTRGRCQTLADIIDEDD